ncbi:MAG: hypothetical protein ALECFALPRED_006719, partial [Alectoria fallacina]
MSRNHNKKREKNGRGQKRSEVYYGSRVVKVNVIHRYDMSDTMIQSKRIFQCNITEGRREIMHIKYAQPAQ